MTEQIESTDSHRFFMSLSSVDSLFEADISAGRQARNVPNRNRSENRVQGSHSGKPDEATMIRLPWRKPSKGSVRFLATCFIHGPYRYVRELLLSKPIHSDEVSSSNVVLQ